MRGYQPESRGDHAGDAERIVSRLLAGIESDHREYTPAKLEIPLGDVEVRVDRFAALFESIGPHTPFPCLRVGRRLPIPIDFWPFWTSDRRLSQRFLMDFGLSLQHFVQRGFWSAKHIFAERDEKVSVIAAPASEALGYFRNHLTQFLTTRFSARRSDISEAPGLLIQVDTHTHGLRVHYSPAYFFDSSNVFGSPSSPVRGWLQPGRYLFGAAKPGQAPDFDFHAEYDLPPISHVSLAI